MSVPGSDSNRMSGAASSSAMRAPVLRVRSIGQLSHGRRAKLDPWRGRGSSSRCTTRAASSKTSCAMCAAPSRTWCASTTARPTTAPRRRAPGAPSWSSTRSTWGRAPACRPDSSSSSRDPLMTEVVTFDADGQHQVADAVGMVEKLHSDPELAGGDRLALPRRPHRDGAAAQGHPQDRGGLHALDDRHGAHRRAQRPAGHRPPAARAHPPAAEPHGPRQSSWSTRSATRRCRGPSTRPT